MTPRPPVSALIPRLVAVRELEPIWYLVINSIGKGSVGGPYGVRLYFSSKARPEMPTFYEFFAGGGMARAGLGDEWTCLFANDIDAKKGAAYEANWGARELVLRDVASVTTSELPGRADLVWASFPCQSLVPARLSHKHNS